MNRRHAIAIVGGAPLGIALLFGEPTSPFLPPHPAEVHSEAAGEHYEFAGVIATGKQTLLGIVDGADQRSFWIAVGERSGDIEAIAYNAKNDEAVLKIRGEIRVLRLRAPSGKPPVRAAEAVPASSQNSISEREARGLVQDLLDISVRQRKAAAEKSPDKR